MGAKVFQGLVGGEGTGQVPSFAPSSLDPGSRSSGYRCQDRSERATTSISLCQVNSSPFPSRAPPLSPGAVLLGRECFRIGGCTHSSPCEQELSLALVFAQFHRRVGIQ